MYPTKSSCDSYVELRTRNYSIPTNPLAPPLELVTVKCLYLEVHCAQSCGLSGPQEGSMWQSCGNWRKDWLLLHTIRLTRDFLSLENEEIKEEGFWFCILCGCAPCFHAGESNPLSTLARQVPNCRAIILSPKKRFWWEMIQEQLLVLIFWDSVSD